MKLKAFNILLFCFVTVNAFSQYRLSGVITSRGDTTAVKECMVYLNDDKRFALSDRRGRFLFEDLPNGSYQLHFVTPDFKYEMVQVNISDTDEFIHALLQPKNEMLEEILITDAQSSFGFTRMRSVEGTGIYEGKK